MGRLFILVGPSGSGKSTVAKFMEESGVERIVTYTSRPIREGEVCGKDYHFVDESFFESQKDQFLEINSYNNWLYGTMIEERKNDKCIILTPAGARIAKKRYPDAKIVYLATDRREALMRILKRGDNVDEAIRRNLSDVGMFDGFENEADIVVDTEPWSAKFIAGMLYAYS